MIDKIHNMVLSDRRIQVRKVVKATDISQGTVFSILHEKLGVKKISARWVLGLLSEENKRNRLVDSKAILALFRRYPDNPFLRRYITVDETWIHDNTPGIFKGERAPKKTKKLKSAGKVMATVFWDANGIFYTDYLEKGQTITGAYYVSLLHQLREEIKKKRPHLKRKKILFHQDNAQVHTCTVSMAKIMELKFELLQHLPYSPDLAPSDFFYFQTWKNGSSNNGSRRTRRYRVKRRLCWKIKCIQNNMFFYHFLRTYWTTLVLFIRFNLFSSFSHFARWWVFAQIDVDKAEIYRRYMALRQFTNQNYGGKNSIFHVKYRVEILGMRHNFQWKKSNENCQPNTIKILWRYFGCGLPRKVELAEKGLKLL